MPSMPKSDPAISDQLRAAIESSGVSRYRIWKQTGIAQAVLSKFMAGKGGLSMEGIDAIGRQLHLQLVADPAAPSPAAATARAAKRRRKPKEE